MSFAPKSMARWIVLLCGLVFLLEGGAGNGKAAQAQTPAPTAIAPFSQLGTVKTVSGNTLTLATDTGVAVTVTVPTGAQVLQLAVGSTELKTAAPSQFSEIAVGDRVLATGKGGQSTTNFNALRVILIKSTAIAQMQAAQQADWKARGTGGIVSSVDTAKGTIVLQSGSKKLTVVTGGATKFRRFEGGSVKYEDSKPGTLAQIQPKNQLQVLGNKSADGLTIQAEEIMSGSFLNLSGLVTSIDPVTGKIAFKDLATKKIMTVNVTSSCDMRNIPLETATMLANRSKGGGTGGGRGGRGGRGGGGGGDASAAVPVDSTLAAAGVDTTLGAVGTDAGATGTAGQEDSAGAMRRSAGADLSQMMPRLPAIQLTDLKVGDAVMVVASEPSSGASTVDAITLLTGVEPLLTANPNGGMSLGMSISGGGGGGGGE